MCNKKGSERDRASRSFFLKKITVSALLSWDKILLDGCKYLATFQRIKNIHSQNWNSLIFFQIDVRIQYSSKGVKYS